MDCRRNHRMKLPSSRVAISYSPWVQLSLEGKCADTVCTLLARCGHGLLHAELLRRLVWRMIFKGAATAIEDPATMTMQERPSL